MTKTDYLLTVIIPVYNTEQYLERCLDSILNQSFKQIKLLIINDNSSDHCSNIIQHYVNKYGQIETHSNSQNMGPGYSRNIGLESVNTKYVSFLDSDDWLDSNAYLNAVSFLEKTSQVDIAMFGIKTEFDDISLSQTRYNYPATNIINNAFALSLLCNIRNQDCSISALLGNKVFRTEYLQTFNIRFENIYFEDVSFTFKAILHARNIALLSEYNLHYYQREQSIMHDFSSKYIDNLFETFTSLKSYLNRQNLFYLYKKDFDAYFRKCYKSVLNTIFNNVNDIALQKKYILYFFETLFKTTEPEKLMDYLDIQQLRQILLL